MVVEGYYDDEQVYELNQEFVTIQKLSVFEDKLKEPIFCKIKLLKLYIDYFDFSILRHAPSKIVFIKEQMAEKVY